MEKKVLTLTVSKQWFDMIADGRKNEEYREIKPYWIKRLVNQDADRGFIGLDEHGIKNVIYGELEYIPTLMSSSSMATARIVHELRRR